MTYKRF